MFAIRPALLLLCSVFSVFGAVDFQREIRPILSDACFHCHGPDKGSRMAGLRLDTREGAFEQRKNGQPVVPGKPAESLLLQRINHAKAGLRMPPAASHKTLTDAQKLTLKRWIEQGAPWTEHWAFVAPQKKPLPVVKAAAWVKNPIDNFILAKLEQQSLPPAAEADRRTLARRVSLDLTGLPPDPAIVEAFVVSKDPEAYSKLVDKYLSSQHYGEHRARYWLDAARYADTHGIHVDNYREMWPYRDWVIQAFNRNMPFDQFTVEQIAGDLLPNRSLEQQIASGFHRCNVTTNEAGVITEEVEAIYAKDRVDTTSTVFLGLTLGCATCHDHKFDPLSQKDFYSMAAFYRNTTQNPMDGNIPDTPPVIVVPRDEDRARWSQLREDEAQVRAKKTSARAAAPTEFAAWLNSQARRNIPAPLDLSTEVFSLRTTADQAWINNEGMNTQVQLKDGVTLESGRLENSKALLFEKNASVELPNQPMFDSGKAFSIATWVYFPKGEDSFAVASQLDPKNKSQGLLLEIGARVVNFRMTGGDGKSITIRAGHMEQFMQGSWNHIVVTYDASRQQAGLGLYLNGRAVPTQGGGDQNVKLTGNIATTKPLLLAREGVRGFPGGKIAEFQILNRAITEEEALQISQWTLIEQSRIKETDALSAEERDALLLHFLSHNDESYRKLNLTLSQLNDERRAIRERGSITLVMEEKPGQAMANILYRGMYDQKREEVKPAVPTVLPPLPESAPRNRLGLAKWMVDPANPLVSRVTVNRLWQEVFGTGIVKTSEDFGSQGEAPSHPELLDWLAVEFRESGWDIKKLMKLMVSSSTYRQQATATPAKLKADPENRLLSHGPRFRLDGELVRDYALASSGLLVGDIGGPSVKPYQPEGVWETVAMNGSNTRFYKPDTGDKLYRRSLYTFWKRSAPPPSMDIFNAPTRESCTVRRERTNTPLQALVTMNDPQYVEASRHLAQVAIQAGGKDLNKKLDAITLRVLARTFTPAEREIVRRTYVDLSTHYKAHPELARKLIAVGESKSDATIDASEFASWTMLASDILNLDEALNK